jgi:hypothetical protein
MSVAANHMTAGRDSRLAVFAAMDFEYQDSGLLGALTGGNLDASNRIATGSTYCLREIERTNRNSPAPALVDREGSSS